MFHIFLPKIFKNSKLRTKLLVSYLFVVLLPVIIIGYFLITRTTDAVLNQTDYINEINFHQITNNIVNQLSRYTDLSDTILIERQLNDYVSTDYTSDVSYFDKYNDYRNIVSTYTGILKIRMSENAKVAIYTSNNSIITDNDFICSIDENIKNTPWFNDVLASNGANVIYGPYVNNNGKQVFLICRLLTQSIRYINIFTVEVQENEIYKFIEREAINKKIFLVDSNNKIISSNDRNFIGKNISGVNYLSGIDFNKYNSFKKLNIGSGRNTVFVDYLNEKKVFDNWKVICFISSESLVQQIGGIVKNSLLVCLVSVFITIIFVFLFSNAITIRYRKLLNNMSKIKEGKYNVAVDDGNDEISELSKNFKSMAEKIDYLVNEVYEAELQVKDLEIEKKEAKIFALQSQINPHFLFNTMESIRMDLWLKQEYEISDVIARFSAFLRKSIEWSNDKNTIIKEKVLVEDYLQIQKYRYVDKLDYQINIDSEFDDCSIPIFILQPIVENAIGHGIELKKGKGCVTISAEEYEDDLRIIVEDDGIGIPEDTLIKIKTALNSEQDKSGKTRIGLRNVHQRLILQFGSKYGLTIDSHEGKGTRVNVLLPRIYPKRGETNV